MLSKADNAALAQAIAEAERATCAELVAVIAPASDAYHSFILLYGLLLGSAVGVGLWAQKIITDFPLLLAMQLGVMLTLSMAPWLRHLCVRLVPMHIRHHRAAHRAYAEYLMLSRHVPAATPIVLLYVSLAERYAHIQTSRMVREKIPDTEWNAIVREFTAAMPTQGLRDACIGAVRQAAGLLSRHFPA